MEVDFFNIDQISELYRSWPSNERWQPNEHWQPTFQSAGKHVSNLHDGNHDPRYAISMHISDGKIELLSPNELKLNPSVEYRANLSNSIHLETV